MQIQIDCYPCILSQLSELAKKAASSEEECHTVVRRLLKLVLDAPPGTTPPEFAGYFHAVINELTGDSDPFREVKDKSTELGLALLPELRELAAAHADPFEAAVRLAIGGNIIDYGVDPNFNLAEAEQGIRGVFDLALDHEALGELRRRMEKARTIFYMLDNCGEAVVDRLLVEPFAEKITIGVRGKPILNDVTRREAAMSGYDFVPITDTGDMVPGVSLRTSSAEFLEKLRSADLIVSKGQGNFESLDGLPERPIFFLLRVKCPVISRRVSAPIGSLQIIGKNLA